MFSFLGLERAGRAQCLSKHMVPPGAPPLTSTYGPAEQLVVCGRGWDLGSDSRALILSRCSDASLSPPWIWGLGFGGENRNKAPGPKLKRTRVSPFGHLFSCRLLGFCSLSRAKGGGMESTNAAPQALPFPAHGGDEARRAQPGHRPWCHPC